MDILSVIEALVYMSLLAVAIVLIAVQFLPNNNIETDESDSNMLL